ncbi:unnamed protein product [Rotaria sordida]|uniref:Uncharacterized protein n=1 Tax=Rotaria sordida TaxID=392033 RepID=A0A815D847_9BILA|nr:unnamed protein product [Rotaria sordida]CAF1571533.1 unnamed protein product [Rotaria sordida]
MASAQFQILSILCRTSRRVVNGALIEFAAMTILSPSALSRDVISTYIGTSIEPFQKNTLDNFRSFYQFVSSLIKEQQFLSALRTNFYTRGVLGSNNFVTFPAIYPQQVDLTQSSFMSNETCQCDRTSDCVYPAGIYNQTRSIIPNEVFSLDVSPLFMIPGFQVGCLPQNALFQSTLECFYNQTCLDIVISLTGALRTVSPLNISNSNSRFSPTTTIAVLFDNLMIESWENSIHFATYFQTCAPKACSYSYVQRFFLIYMITTIVSIFGGIRVAVYIASPLFVKFILRLCRQRVQMIEADEGHESSRIISQQVIVRNPSIDQFEHLHDMYSSILSCPCRNSSIQRSTFISSEVQIHPFCTSSFVRDDRWLQYWTMKFLDGIVLGCTFMNGLSQSTFECFYDDDCVNQLNELLGTSFTTFNLNATQFPPTTPIGSILDEGSIAAVDLSANYSAYFQICAPSICQYHYVEQNGVVYIFTTLLGLYGGLTAGLHIFVWYLLGLYRVMVKRCSCLLQRVHPSSST